MIVTEKPNIPGAHYIDLSPQSTVKGVKMIAPGAKIPECLKSDLRINHKKKKHKQASRQMKIQEEFWNQAERGFLFDVSTYVKTNQIVPHVSLDEDKEINDELSKQRIFGESYFV